MKKEWSKAWTGSSQPRKQRKFRYNAPLHVKHKFISANLSKELRGETGRRSMPLRKGDEVKIMRGNSKGLKGPIERVDVKKSKIYIENIKVKKVDGSEVSKPINASNLMIIKLNLEDKMRKKIIARKDVKVKPVKKTVEKKEEKPKAEKVEKAEKEVKKEKSE